MSHKESNPPPPPTSVRPAPPPPPPSDMIHEIKIIENICKKLGYHDLENTQLSMINNYRLRLEFHNKNKDKSHYSSKYEFPTWNYVIWLEDELTTLRGKCQEWERSMKEILILFD